MKIINIHNEVPTVQHTVIAEQTGNLAKSIADLIQIHKEDFEYFGGLAISNRETLEQGGRPQKIYNLNEQQATLLMTYMKNTEIVRIFKKTLVKEFYKLREQNQLEVQETDYREIKDYLHRSLSEHREEIILSFEQRIKPVNKNKIKGAYMGERTKLRKKIAKLEEKNIKLKEIERELSKEFRALTRDYRKLVNKIKSN